MEPIYLAGAARTMVSRITSGLPGTGQTHARNIASTIQGLAVSAEALAKVYDSKSPTETEDAHHKKVVTAAKAFGGQAERVRDRLHEIVQAGMRDIEARSRAKTGLKANEYAGEIRAVIRNMPTDTKLALFNELAEEGRGAELAAVIDAPALLTGVTVEMQQRAKEVLETVHAKAETDERDKLSQVFAEAYDVVSMCANAARQLGDTERLADIEHGEAAAAAALDAFQVATRG